MMIPGYKMSGAAWLAMAALAPVLCEARGEDKLTRFRFDQSKIEIGTVYHYKKSNIDGTHQSRVSLFVAGHDRLEAFKWSKFGRGGNACDRGYGLEDVFG